MALSLPHAMGERYSPLSFLAALGAGGMTANFFVWLLFWVPHPERAVPAFEDIGAAFAPGTPVLQWATGVALAGLALAVQLATILRIALHQFGDRPMAPELVVRAG